MLPIAPLMIEHRLIERMIELIRKETERYEREKNINPERIDAAIDFMRVYADRCHHGKEEGILFRDLKEKELPDELKGIVSQLIEEHQWGRKAVADLIEAKRQYMRGDKHSLPAILTGLRYLVDFYPKHIEKEDKHLFLPCMNHFTTEEKEAMLKEESEFDKSLIHQIYSEKISKWNADAE